MFHRERDAADETASGVLGNRSRDAQTWTTTSCDRTISISGSHQHSPVPVSWRLPSAGTRCVRAEQGRGWQGLVDVQSMAGHGRAGLAHEAMWGQWHHHWPHSLRNELPETQGLVGTGGGIRSSQRWLRSRPTMKPSSMEITISLQQSTRTKFVKADRTRPAPPFAPIPDVL